MEEGGCNDILLFLPTTGRRDGRDDGDAPSLLAEQLNDYPKADVFAMNGADVREHFKNELQDEMSSRMNEEEARKFAL